MKLTRENKLITNRQTLIMWMAKKEIRLIFNIKVK